MLIHRGFYKKDLLSHNWLVCAFKMRGHSGILLGHVKEGLEHHVIMQVEFVYVVRTCFCTS